jgi:hypothetical protein
LDELKDLQLFSILADYQPSQNEIEEVFLPNEEGEWKHPCDLILTLDDKFNINFSLKLNKEFQELAKNFNVSELSPSNLITVTDPISQAASTEVFDFFKSFGKYIAFKIDCNNHETLNAEFQEKIQSVTYYEVNSIRKSFPEVNPIYSEEIKLLFDDLDSKLIYAGNWKTNESLKQFILSEILGINIPFRWFDNLILRWNESEIIKKLIDEFGDKVPFLLSNNHQNSSEEDIVETDISSNEETINPFSDISPSDELFIRSVIKGDFELNEKLDVNTTAKIKTLIAIRSHYEETSTITDEGRFLKVGSDEIIVRSAQNGLLYLDIFHWGRLEESNVKLSVYTKNQIELFSTQEELINYTKPQNKFGIVRMPNEYGLEDYNSLDQISDKGKWHYIFIVNENTKAALNYKEFIDYSDPNLFNGDNF